MFFCSAMIGMTTKKDLTILGRVLMMGVIGLILIGLVNIIIPSAFNGDEQIHSSPLGIEYSAV